jgi:hypothetical protein
MCRLSILSFIAGISILMAGPGSASATRLCSTNSLPCSSSYPSGTSVMGQSPFLHTVVLTNSLSNVTCTGSSFELKTTSSGGGAGTPVTGQIQAFTLTGCTTSSGMQCTAAAQFLPWKAEVTGGASGNGVLWINLPAFQISCGFLLNCSYEAGTPRPMAILGGSPANIEASGWLLTVSTPGCPNEAYFDGQYEAKSPKPLFVTTS